MEELHSGDTQQLDEANPKMFSPEQIEKPRHFEVVVTAARAKNLMRNSLDRHQKSLPSRQRPAQDDNSKARRKNSTISRFLHFFLRGLGSGHHILKRGILLVV